MNTRKDKIIRPYARWNGFGLGYEIGTMVTPYGNVNIYSQGDDKSIHYTELGFAYEGCQYTRTWRKRFSKRGLAILASRFAKEISS